VPTKHNQTLKPTSPLHPLPVPDNQFDTVALDFIGPLPEEDGNATILTMTDLLGADIHIAGTHSTYTAAQIAIVLFNEWYCENSLMLHLGLTEMHSSPPNFGPHSTSSLALN
jgi:hypothetical protein